MSKSHTEDYLRTRATQIVEEKAKGSTLFDDVAEGKIPRFSPSEIVFGKYLGHGGFCTVTELQAIKLKDGGKNDEESEGGGVTQNRAFISANYLRNGEARYAIKKLTKDLYGTRPEQTFISGVIDLMIEVKFLAVIRHPNIIKMRAIADTEPNSKDFFIVLDRLDETLSKRVEVWKKEKGKGGIFKKTKEDENEFIHRLIVGMDIASALKYLHDNNIVYRDLKPDNLGFDVRDDVKLFDFGLARELEDKDKVGEDLYQMSGNTGSARYMAPEVALNKPYSKPADVYSLGIILWQICELETPFKTFDMVKFRQKVVNGGARPKMNKKWSSSLSILLGRCWATDTKQRPSSEETMDLLRNEILGSGNSDDYELDISNRTEKSLNIKS